MNTAQTNWTATPVVAFCDVLVLGSGIAACQAAIAAAREGKTVRMVGHARGASPFILGFNVPLAPGDSVEQFEEDTFEGGYELGDRALIGLLCREAREAFAELVEAGVAFESQSGNPALRHLSGSRYPRSVYVKSGTGTAIYRTLLAKLDALGVERHSGLRVLRLVVMAGRVTGAIAAAQDGSLFAFGAGSTVLALGGIGGLYDNSTYPTDVVGDAFALALEVGATLIDMEFVQFEPTVVLHPDRVRGMEMPTAMLGDGATLVNAEGERFMWRYNPNGEKLIEKAKMALCIQREIDEGRGAPGGGVWFDATMLADECLRGYETHYRRLVASGLDPALKPVEVAPAAHSLMGGVEIDDHCQSGVPGLFACGEAAGGVHGASRIAGNGAADAIILSRVAGRFAARFSSKLDQDEFDSHVRKACSVAPPLNTGRAKQLRAIVSRTLAENVGIRRSAEGLKTAVDVLDGVAADVADLFLGAVLDPYLTAHNAVLVGQSIARSALLRQESRGAHFRADFPDIDQDWTSSIRASRLDNGNLFVRRDTTEVEVVK